MTTNDGIEFIGKSRKKEPFFLHLSYFDPHPPYMAPSEFTSRYNSEDMIIPSFVSPEKLSQRLAEHARALHYDRIKDTDLTETMRYYYAAIEWGVDFQVGRVIKTLEENGMIENTIIIFTSDHGDFMGHHRMVRKGIFLYDSLLHIPMIFYAPAKLAQGHRVSNISQSVDLFPTIVDLTGGSIPKDLPGRSLRLLLEGGRQQDRNDFPIFASAAYSDLPKDYFDNPEPAYKPDSDIPFHTRIEKLTWKTENRIAMARTLDWKLILNESRPPELYNMAGNRIEQENVIEKQEYTAIRTSLEKTIESIWKW
jgi:arylsulfatase A-like enzyme